MMKRITPVLVVLLGWASTAWAAAPPPLTILRAVHGLSHEDASRELPAAVEATVTYFRWYEKTLFVQDGDVAMYVNATTDLRLVPGDRVLVRGTTRDSFRPIVFSSDLALLRHGNPPVPVAASFGKMIRAELDCRYVTVRGSVLSANLGQSSGRWVTQLELRTDSGNAGVTMDSGDPAPLKGLLDAEVEVTGVAAGRFDGKMQQTGVLIHATSFADVKIVRKAPVDAWSIPVSRMDEVLHKYDVQDRTQRVRVQGTITYYQPDSMAVLQDGDRSIRVLTPSITPLRVGDRGEAIGLPFVDNGFLTLKLGEIRSMGAAAPIMPAPVTWDELASGKRAFDLVSMEGTMVSQVREHAQDVYIISASGHLFSATVRHPFVYERNVSREPPPMPEIRPGSRVRITGVAILDDGNPFNGAMAFGLLLRSASDVAVIASPSLLTVTNLLRMVSLLLLVVVAVSAWGWTMKRKVHRQTAALATRIAAEAALERRRSAVLEDINGSRPLGEILEQIAALVSFNLNGASCWLQIGNDAAVGKCPTGVHSSTVLRQEIRARSGSLHGTIFAVLAPSAPPDGNASETLSMGAWLATLAIETRGLYSDLVHRSQFDLLTDIHNRFSLETRLDRLIEEAAAQGRLFGLIYIDLDEFKQVNDRYGHRVGDHYLQEAALRMKRQLRPGDMLARLGGDEFAALVEVVRSRADVEEIALRMERCFDEPFSLEGYRLRGSASVGIAVYGEDGVNKDALLSASDAAMYIAKHSRV